MKQIHESWVTPLSQQIQKHYVYVANFCSANDLRVVDVSRFLKGLPLPDDVFDKICKALKQDEKEVQLSRLA